jgi:hypothetical protein
MNNPRLLIDKINNKLDALKSLSDYDIYYDAIENPTKLLEHYEEELAFFQAGKEQLASMLDMKILFEEEQKAMDGLKSFYLEYYPGLELNLLRVICVLKERV